jgi:hypothetical protein
LGFAVRGEAFSMAAAYAFESVLKAVGDVGSMSPCLVSLFEEKAAASWTEKKIVGKNPTTS